MRALTVHQPYASLIVAGAKPFEFRKGRPPAALIGERIAIHASASPITPRKASDLFLAVRDRARGSIIQSTLYPYEALPILARAWAPLDEPLPVSAGIGTAIIDEPRRAWDVAEHRSLPVRDEEADLWAWPMLEVER